MSNTNLEKALKRINAAIERNEQKIAEHQGDLAVQNLYVGVKVGLEEARSFILAWRD